MNLIQVQDRLKDMPTQAIMSYANGSNPDVPPYLALGELNRRKQMEQKHAEAPQGTVKDQIEQSVKLAQAQKAAQAQGQQKMTEAMGSQQSPVPGGTPQPQEQPEAGIAQLPTGPMNFRDGGIVSFDGENASLVDQNMPSDEESQFMKDLRKFGSKFIETEEQKARRRELQKTQVAGAPLKYFTQPASEYEKNKAARELAGQNVLPSDLDPSRYIPESTDRAPTSTADVNALSGQGAGRGPSAGPRPPSAGGAGGGGAPQAGGPAQDDDLAMLRKMRDELKAPTPVDRDAERAAFAKTNPYLNTPAGSKLEELHARIAQRDEEDRARFLKNEEERKQGRLNRGLLAGAEATRGRGGIGALGSFFMGYGKAGEDEDEAARTRTDAQRAMERQQEVLRAEVMDKIESARRAEARGDFAAAIQDKKDAATASAQFAQNKFNMQQAIATAAEAKRHNMSVEEYQRATLHYAKMSASKGPEIEQIYNFIRKNRDDLSPAQAYTEAVSLSRSGIAGAKLDADIQHKAEQEFAKDPLTPGLAQKVNMARFGKNKAEIKAAEDAYQAHRKDFYKNKNLPLLEGSGGTAVDYSQFKVEQVPSKS